MPAGVAACLALSIVAVVAFCFVIIKYMPSGKVIKPPSDLGY